MRLLYETSLAVFKSIGHIFNMEKKYQVVCYIRVDPDEVNPMTYEQALVEKEHLKFLQPDNIYRIEEIEDDLDRRGRFVFSLIGDWSIYRSPNIVPIKIALSAWFLVGAPVFGIKKVPIYGFSRGL